MTERLRRLARRLLYVAIIVGRPPAAVGEGVHGQVPPADAREPAGVIPDSTGAIAEVLLHYDPDLASELAPLYRDLFESLPPDVRLNVVCSSEQAATDFVSGWEVELRRRRVTVVDVGLAISIWARDRCIARQPVDLLGRVHTFVPILDQAYVNEKRNDLLAQELLAEAHVAPGVLDSSLFVEGGNVVSNERHVFVGANVLSDNEGIPTDRLTDELRRMFGREPLVIGDRNGGVPSCHVDMYLTPVSNDTVLVANPRLAAMIQSRDGDEEGNCGDEDRDPAVCLSGSLQEQFDSVAELLQDCGYRVLRLPALVSQGEIGMVTYNNVLMDQRGECRTVYMPVYGIPDLDETAAAIYRAVGFEVRTVDVSEVYSMGGAIRCVANVTERRPVDAAVQQATRRTGVRLIKLAGFHGYERWLHRSSEHLARRGSRGRITPGVDR